MFQGLVLLDSVPAQSILRVGIATGSAILVQVVGTFSTIILQYSISKFAESRSQIAVQPSSRLPRTAHFLDDAVRRHQPPRHGFPAGSRWQREQTAVEPVRGRTETSMLLWSGLKRAR